MRGYGWKWGGGVQMGVRVSWRGAQIITTIILRLIIRITMINNYYD